jgi:acetyl-CoA carboxylase biotin carboxyl carrier protein
MASVIKAHITGTVWKIEVNVGDKIEEGQTVAILESMKMEMPVEAEDAGVIEQILVAPNDSVKEGQPLMTLKT